MYSIICVFLIHIIIFTLQYALFSHLLIHADLVYSFHVPNSIPLNDNSAVYLPTLQATDSRDISLLLAMLQLTLSYLALRTRTWFHSAFISIPSPGPTKGKSETLSPWSLLAGFLWSPATDHYDKEKRPRRSGVALPLLRRCGELCLSPALNLN